LFLLIRITKPNAKKKKKSDAGTGEKKKRKESNPGDEVVRREALLEKEKGVRWPDEKIGIQSRGEGGAKQPVARQDHAVRERGNQQGSQKKSCPHP